MSTALEVIESAADKWTHANDLGVLMLAFKTGVDVRVRCLAVFQYDNRYRVRTSQGNLDTTLNGISHNVGRNVAADFVYPHFAQSYKTVAGAKSAVTMARAAYGHLIPALYSDQHEGFLRGLEGYLQRLDHGQGRQYINREAGR